MSLEELIAAAKLGGEEKINQIITRREKRKSVEQTEQRPTTAEMFAAALQLVGEGNFVMVKDVTAIMEYHGWRSNSRSEREKLIAVKSAIYNRKRAGEENPKYALPIDWSRSRYGLFAYRPSAAYGGSAQPDATGVSQSVVPSCKIDRSLATTCNGESVPEHLAVASTRFDAAGAVVLHQNQGSVYDDQEGSYYHFPDIYRSQISSGDIFIYYRSGSPSCYFGAGQVDQIKRDQELPGLWYARLADYRAFTRQVAYKDESGRYLERRPGIKQPPFQRAVRRIDQESIARILRYSR